MEAALKRVTWTKRSLSDLNQITIFNTQILGREKALEIAHKIINYPLILENEAYDFRNIGAIDESFSHLKKAYRKLIYGHYKITFRIQN